VLLAPKFQKLMIFFNYIALAAPSVVAAIDFHLDRQTGRLPEGKAASLKSMRQWLTYYVPLVCQIHPLAYLHSLIRANQTIPVC